MKFIFCLFIAVFSIHCFAQKQYLVEYDRIKNTETYKELIVTKGNVQEKLIKKPQLKKGDLIRFRAANVNPAVFKFVLKNEFKDKENTSNSVKIQKGFSLILSELDDNFFSIIGSEVKQLSSSSLDIPDFTNRGATSKNEAMLNSIKNITNFKDMLSNSYKLLQEYKKSIDNFYATDLTKEEILNSLKIAKQSLDIQKYNSQIRLLEKQHEVFEKDSVFYHSERKKLEKSYDKLMNSIHKSLINPNKIDELIAIVENFNFTPEQIIVVGYDDRIEDISDKEKASYTFEFRSKLINSNESYDYDNLVQNHQLNLPVQSNGGFSWSNGFALVSPFKGYNNYEIEYVDFDSISIVQGTPLPSSRFTIGTNLRYDFKNINFIKPHALVGISIEVLSTRGDKPINFLFGGGISLKNFPHVSLSGGIAFCQNNKLGNGYFLNTNYKKIDEALFDNTLLPYVKTTYSPGYFICLNINL